MVEKISPLAVFELGPLDQQAPLLSKKPVLSKSSFRSQNRQMHRNIPVLSKYLISVCMGDRGGSRVV